MTTTLPGMPPRISTSVGSSRSRIGSQSSLPSRTAEPAGGERAESLGETTEATEANEEEAEGPHQTTSASSVAASDIGKKTNSTLFKDARKSGRHGCRRR